MARISEKAALAQRWKGETGQREIKQRVTPFLWPTFREGRPQWHIIDYESYVEEGFNINTLVYSAIMYKVRARYGVRLRAYKGPVDHPILVKPEHPLAQLVTRPNPHQSYEEFQGQNEVYINLSGNCYIFMVRESTKELPRALYSLRPDRVFVIPGGGTRESGSLIMGYLYVPEGRTAWLKMDKIGQRRALESGDVLPIITENMMHIKFPNPGDPLEGMGEGLSPLMACAQSVDVDNMVTSFLNLFFKRGTMMQGILSYDVPMDPTTIGNVRQQWKDIYGGFTNWAEIGILDQGGKYQRVAPTFEEMGFESIDARNETRVCGPFGVPPILLGTRIGLLRSTYCLPVSSRISTPFGLKHISDIVSGDWVWSFVDGHLEPKRVTWSGKVGRKLLYRVKTKNRTLVATGNHPLMVRIKGHNRTSNETRGPTCGWKSVADIKVAESISNLSFGKADRLVQPKWYPDLNGDVLPDGNKAEIGFLQFCGAILGDGTVQLSNGAVNMAIPKSNPCRTYYEELAACHFTKRAGNYHDIDNREPANVGGRDGEFWFCAMDEARRLDALGFGGRVFTKRIPGWVYSLSRELRLAFLAGIVDTDGHITSLGELHISFANEELTYDVRELLISVGIQCGNVRRQDRRKEDPRFKREMYTMFRIAASNARQIAEIPFVNPVYRKRAIANQDRKFKGDGADAQKVGLAEHLGFYRVVGIEQLDVEDVYDITVEGGHSFVADGIVVHNSNVQEARKGCWEDTLVPEGRLFEVEYHYHLKTDDGGFVAFDYSRIPALQKNIPELVTAWMNMVRHGVPKDIATEVTGLPLPPLEDGQKIYHVRNLVPVGGELLPELPSSDTIGQEVEDDMNRSREQPEE